MGMDLTVYTGFYFSIKSTDFTKTIKVNCCSNESCKEFKRENPKNFCSECGSKVEEKIYKKVINSNSPRELLPDELKDLVDQHEYSNGQWFFNYSFEDYKELCNQMSPNSGDDEFVIPYEKINDKMVYLKEKDKHTSSILKYMKDNYGEDSISLNYGVIAYYS
jgi:hypothetical protein